MRKKRQRVFVDPSKIEFDPDFFDQPLEQPADDLLLSDEILSGDAPAGRAALSTATPRSESSEPTESAAESAAESVGGPGDELYEAGPSSAAPPSQEATASPPSEEDQESQRLNSGAGRSLSVLPEVVEIGSSDNADVVELCDSDSAYSDVEILEVVHRSRSAPAAQDSTERRAPGVPAVPAAPAAPSVAGDYAKPKTETMAPPPLPLPALPLRRAQSHDSESDDASQRKRARKEDSLRFVSLHVESRIPGHEGTFDIEWSLGQALFELRDRFDPKAVLVHDGSKKPWFYSPKKIAGTSSEIAIEIVSEHQWDDLVRKAELGEFEIPSATPDDDVAAASGAPASPEPGFVITIASKASTVRAKVTPQTTVRQLIDHFIAETKTPQSSKIRVVLDGDTLELADTIGELDVEEDDRLDVYIE